MTARIGAFIARNKIIVLAIGGSLLWHLFWLSSITIVAPTVRVPVRFSRVSFLGPVMGQGMTEVRMGPREWTLLEARHLRRLGSVSSPAAGTPERSATGAGTSAVVEKRLISLVDTAVSGEKITPVPRVYD